MRKNATFYLTCFVGLKSHNILLGMTNRPITPKVAQCSFAVEFEFFSRFGRDSHRQSSAIETAAAFRISYAAFLVSTWLFGINFDYFSISANCGQVNNNS